MTDVKDTLVFAVGISSYDLGPSWRLPNAAEHALEFAEWAHGRGVPLDRIHLFLSRADAQRLNARIVASGLSARPATFSEVVTSFAWDELTKKNASLLYMFWSSHGSVSEDNRRVLFCEDASLTSQLLFDLNDFFARLRSSSYERFARQIAYVDACANRFEELGFDASLGQVRAGKGRSSHEGIKQNFFFAADSGEQANEGAFGAAVLTALGGRPAEWPVDHDAVVSDVLPRFEQTGQHPVQLVWTTGAGDLHGAEGVSGELPASRFVNAAALARQLPVRALRGLAEIALNFGELGQDSGAGARQRDALYASLCVATGRPVPIRQPSTPRVEMLHIVGAALQWNEEDLLARDLGQLAPAAEFTSELGRLALIQEVRAIVEQLPATTPEIRTEYGKAIKGLSRESARDSATTIDAMLDELYQISAAGDPRRPVWEFLMRLADRFPADRAGIDAFLASKVIRGTLKTLRKKLDLEQQFVLSINMIPGDNEEPSIAEITARLVIEGTGTGLRTFEPQAVTTWEAADAWAAETVRQCREIVLQKYQRGPGALLVEFLMPAAFLERTPHDLKVRVGREFFPLEELHPVVVRLRERIAQRGDVKNLDEWERIASRINRERPGAIHWMDSTRKTPTIDDCEGVVALRFVPAEALFEIVSEGFPFMAWLRSEPNGGDWTAFEREFDEWVKKSNIKDLARAVRAIRESTAVAGVNLTLFWDDPDQVGHWLRFHDVSSGGN